jgi:hypothetical protein
MFLHPKRVEFAFAQFSKSSRVGFAIALEGQAIECLVSPQLFLGAIQHPLQGAIVLDGLTHRKIE